jgi:hypothetical protein
LGIYRAQFKILVGLMRVVKADIWGQIYVLPYIKLTHTRALNGDLEIIVGWLKWELVVAI